jgi:enoyl-CoA hydratase
MTDQTVAEPQASDQDDLVRFRIEGRVGIITLNRPTARNAVNHEVAVGIEAAIDRIEDDPEVWVGILTGTAPVFSAGADLKVMGAGGFGQLSTERGGFAGLVRRVRHKPLIAAVNGAALAGGFELVLSCDLVVAATTAYFGIPEVKRSLLAAAGGLLRLPHKVPVNLAMEMALTGDPITAERAADLGLVNQLCAADEVVDAALALAARITANAPVAVRESRRVLLAAAALDDEAGWDLSAAGVAVAIGAADFEEGIKAFIEKRPPEWKGA